LAERGGAQGRSLRNVTPGNRTSRRPPGSRRGTCVFGLVRHPRDASTSASLHPARVRVVRFRTRLYHSRVDMPTFGTHTPDLPYQPSSEMAWGPRGAEHMKSGADREYEERVRRRQRRCSVAPGPPVASHSWLYMAFNAVVALHAFTHSFGWFVGRAFSLPSEMHRAVFGLDQLRRSSRKRL